MKYSNIIPLVLLLFLQSYNSIKMDLVKMDSVKRSSSYKVEGCFSKFEMYSSENITVDNSNVRCQDVCREEGFILAATQGTYCMCGNIYPKGRKVADTNCNTTCRTWNQCHTVQSCCGGYGVYTVSVVGDIDVSKQVLRRLVHTWQTNTDYRNYLKAKVSVLSPKIFNANWWSTFDHQGWSKCPDGYYMRGLWRNSCATLGCIEEANCVEAPSYLYPARGDMDCYNANWWDSFNNKGWSTCAPGYYMTGLYRSGSCATLGCIEESQCCRPNSQVSGQWGHCYDKDVWDLFDQKGWTTCNSEYYLAGLYKNDCNTLGCIELFKCCKMGGYNRASWIENPTFSISVEDTSGQFKHCTMEANDGTQTSTTYSCKPLTHRKNMLKLNAKSFKIEDETQLSVAKPKPIKNFRPVICSSHSSAYTCKKTLSVNISTSRSFTIGSGFSVSVMVGASVEVEASAFGSDVKTGFRTEVTGTTSLNVESSKSEEKSVADVTEVSYNVPANTEITINMMRTVVDLMYKWKAVFQLLGKYNVKWKDGTETWQDVTTILSGSKREMYAFGTWQYPGTDVIRVIVTDKYGRKEEVCTHEGGKKTSCSI